MARRVLDTSVLIRHWRARFRPSAAPNIADAQQWAEELVRLRDCDKTVTPVCIEFLCGTRSSQELQLARSYLSIFNIIDEGHIIASDFTLARRFAERVPPSGRPRQLGDCLIRAIAQRLHHDVDTFDEAFP